MAVPACDSVPAARAPHCDEASEVIFRTVFEAVNDFLVERDEAGRPVEKYLRQKMEYVDSDLAKFANVLMRQGQYCESLAGLSGRHRSHERAGGRRH